ncbi:MAG: cysteine desulfurase, partial [Erysipelotrichaceae bacterium]|nr:cysteine desulfurase [Erysipelotrichaceae bacterium]
LHDQLIDGLKDIARINYDKGLMTLVNISTPVQSEVMLNALNDKGIMISSKSTCGSRKNELNRTLNALGIDENYALRISFDYTNTREEIDYFLKTLKEILNKYA